MKIRRKPGKDAKISQPNIRVVFLNMKGKWIQHTRKKNRE